jgi:hypothetical protein
LAGTTSELVQRRLASLPQGNYESLSGSGEDGQARASTLGLVPEGVSLTQTIKHRDDEHGRLLNVEIHATIGAAGGGAEVEQQPVAVLTSSGSTEYLETDWRA